jgi:VanZ family protein
MRVGTELLTWIVGLVTRYQERRATWLRIAVALAWAALIWWASSQSSVPKPPDPVFSYVWNLGHVVVFGVLGALVLLSTQGCTFKNAVIAVAVAAAYGAIDELHQGSVEGRDMDVWDACSDTLGACIATCTLLWLVGGRRRTGSWLVVWVPLAILSVHMASS